jgi:hypothetical protein
MSERKIDINLTDSNVRPPSREEYDDYASRMIQVLDRSHTIDRFQVADAPPGIHYEWHKDDPLTHARLTAKGFIPDDELAASSKFVHTDGAGNPRIADVRLYTIPKWKHEVLEKISEEKAARAADPRRADKDFMAAIRNEGGYDEVTADSSVENVKGLEVTLTPSKKE